MLETSRAASPVVSGAGTERIPRSLSTTWLWIAIVAGVIAAGAAILVVRYFPFTEKNVIESLRETFPSTITVEHFEVMYFPNAGCKAQGVTFRLLSDSPGVVTIGTLTIQSRYADLLFRPHHIAKVVLEGLRIQVPQLGHASGFTGGYTDSPVSVGEAVANGAVLEFARADSKPPVKFDIHELTLSSVTAKGGMSYRLSMRNPEPSGEIKSSGHFGPFNASGPGKTPLSGTYSFDHGDLSTFDGIAGMVSSNGRFAGPLDKVDLQGTTDTPNFEVVRSGHAAHLTTRFQGTVNGTNGDVALASLNATYLNTRIDAKGDIAHKEGSKGKSTSLDFVVRDGHVQDVLRLFVSEDRPPLAGITSFRAHVTVPPEGRPFLKEVTLQGDFDIDEGHFEDPLRQQDVDKLSQTARGETTDRNAQEKEPSAESENVVSRVRGHVELRNGTARFAYLTFAVPGADARMHGTYNLLNEKIDLYGSLKMDAKFSKSTSGIKSVFAKLLDPFLNKKHGSVVPVVVDGTYRNPHFGLDLNPIHK